jgi:hypothetical protein
MGNYNSVIARRDDMHYVSQGDRDTVLLVWNSLRLQLRVCDFASLTNTAVEACLKAGPPPDSPARLFRLSLDTVVLEMEAEEFWQFSDLMRRATMRLVKRGAALENGFDGWRIQVRRDQENAGIAKPYSTSVMWMN